MNGPSSTPVRQVPPRALILSLAALAVPVAAALLLPDSPGNHDSLLWLLALVPAFLLAYYRGWTGIAASLAVGMATLALTQASANALGRGPLDWTLLLIVVGAYIAITLGIGVFAEHMNRDRSEAERLALTDPLTELPNRRHALLVLDQEFAAARRERPLSVALFDIDGFKDYNDRNGHADGDDALQVFAYVLRQTTRRMNLCSRLGGDEFLCILSETDAEGAKVYADRVRHALGETLMPAAAFTISAGIATFDAAMEAGSDLLAGADKALYQAKQEGRDRVRTYSAGSPATA